MEQLRTSQQAHLRHGDAAQVAAGQALQARVQLHLRGPHRGHLVRDRGGLQAVDALLQGPRAGPEEQGGPRGHAQGRAAQEQAEYFFITSQKLKFLYQNLMKKYSKPSFRYIFPIFEF